MLIDLLNEEEIVAITERRKTYAFGYGEYGSFRNFTDTKDMLREWANKKEFLYKWFGGNLIISKEFEYSKSIDQITEELNKVMYNEKTKVFRHAFNAFLWSDNIRAQGEFGRNEIEWKLRELISTESLASNTYVGDDFTLDLPNGRQYRVTRGCKAIKALGKIADAFNLDGFEDFRIAHSQTLNQKKLKGELVLSIHPLDYMTMSDNDCGWGSCMSWEDNGEYRQGTVEMMNSPMVVVAYLKSSEDMTLYPNVKWSNKKWRQLFVVNEDLIVGIKEYPYYNREITNTVIAWLRDLAKLNLGINFLETQEYYYGQTSFNVPHLPAEKNNFTISFYTGWMYNDFGCMPDYHSIALSETFNPNIIFHRNYDSSPYVEIYYSGKAQCMICGDLSPDLYNEECLACSNCEDFVICDHCGDRFSPSDAYYVDDMNLCYSCASEHVVNCIACHEEHLDFSDGAICPVYVVPRMTKEEQKEQYEKIYNDSIYLEDYDENKEYSYISSAYREHVCDHYDCKREFENSFLIEGAVLRTRGYIYYTTHHYVYFDELNERGKMLYGVNHFKSNKEFLKHRRGSSGFNEL